MRARVAVVGRRWPHAVVHEDELAIEDAREAVWLEDLVLAQLSLRESALLQQILAPSLRSRNPERRKEAIEALENLAAVASHLKHLLLVRDLRRIAK